MSKIDAFYTPPRLAIQMINVCSTRPDVIADFASGDGELLRAASNRWPKAKLIATDISRTALTAIRRRVMTIEASRCNFLSQRSRSRCAVLRNWVGKINLVLLNPPFSCRGGKRISVSTELFGTACSTAMAFILYAFESLHPDGEIVAILPAGSLRSEKDHEAWEQLRQHARVEIISQHGPGTFGECFPTTRIVHIKKATVSSRSTVMSKRAVSRFPLQSHNQVIIQRGTIQMHSIPPGKTPLAHSTDLTNFRLVLNGHKSRAGESVITGPFVAICRVGNPKKEKIALHFTRAEIAISDCIVGLRCNSRVAATQLHSRIVAHWPKLANLYEGTGAKYITISKLARFVKQLGFPIAPHAKAKWQLKRSIENCF